MRRRPRIAATALVLSATAIGAGGCGSDGEDLSPRAAAARADAICREADRRVARLGEPTDTAVIARLAPRSARISDDALARLRRLRVPGEVAAPYGELLARLTAINVLVRRIGEAAENQNVGGLRELDRRAQEERDAAAPLARRLGMSDCGPGT